MIVAATGHRPDKLGGYYRPVFTKLYSLAFEWLKDSKPAGAISGMALGWDTEFAKAAVDLNIPLTAAVPFKGQELMWNQKDQQQYNKLLKLATKVVVVSTGAYLPQKMMVRNCWMVDNCDILLALHDGSAGGTFNTVKYAERQNKPIVNLYDKFKSNN